MTLEELEQQIKSLSRDDREQLYQRLGVVDQSIFWGAEIRIDDWEGRDKVKPRATLIRPNGVEESIDIIASVERNAVSIGHPVILHAIRRWEQICVARHAQGRSEVYQSSKPDFAELAQTHLDRIGRALLKGAKDRAIPKEAALDVYAQKLGLDTDYYYLHFAWQLLGADEIKKTRRPELRLKLLEAQLSDFPALLCRLGDRHHRGHNYPLPRLRLSNFILEQVLFHIVQYELPDKLTQWAVYREPERFFGAVDPTVSPEPVMTGIHDMGHSTWDGYYHVSAYGKSVAIKVSDAIKELGLYSPRVRKLLAAVKGIIGLVDELPGGEFLKGYKTDVIIEFLKSENGKACLKQRPSWPVMLSKFDAWRFPLDKATLRKYRSNARKERMSKRTGEYIPLFPSYTSEVGLAGLDAIPRRFYSMEWEYPDVDGRFLLPAWFNEYRLIEIGNDWLALPVVSTVTKTRQVEDKGKPKPALTRVPFGTDVMGVECFRICRPKN